jgi:phage shock protein C
MNERQDSFGPGPTGLYRIPGEGRLTGVCAGLADYFGVSARALRFVLVFLSLIGFLGPVVVAYLVLAVLLKPKPTQLYRDAEDEAFWRSVTRHPADTVGGLVRRFRELDDRAARLERRLTSPDEVLRAQFREL